MGVKDQLTYLADRIRYYIDTDEKFSIEEMPDKVTEVSGRSFESGMEAGYYNGYDKGKAEGIDEGYSEGYKLGIQIGVEEGIEQGAEVEKKRWWGVYQENGNRVNWLYGFANWYVDSIDPQFDIKPTVANSMLPNIVASNGKYFNIPEIEARNNIKFDFSKCTTFSNFIAWSAIEDLGFVDTTSATTPIFQYCSALKRLSIALKENGSQNCSISFEGDSGLEDLTIVSGYFGSNINLQGATKLLKASFVSVISHLLDSSSGLSATFAKTACDKAFETSVGANDGSTSAEWLNLIATKPNWSIKLV